MQTNLGNIIQDQTANLQYDAQCKTVLANKEILARILKDTVKEVSGLSKEEIMACIEGTPAIGTVPVYAWRNELITGSNTEDARGGEGRVFYDIRFPLLVPGQNEGLTILINVEAQKDFSPGYAIVTRGVYYAARMISSQLGTEFSQPHYDGIKKVYSIWICLDPKKEFRNAIASYHLTKHDLVPGIPDSPAQYDKMEVILICLSEAGEGSTDLLRMLNLLFSSEVEATEKKRRLTDDFGISMANNYGKEIDLMCNLSANVEAVGYEKGRVAGREEGREEGRVVGREEGREEGILSTAKRMFSRGLPIEEIMACTGLSMEKLRALR